MDTSRRDLYWTIGLAAVILLAVVTFWLGGKGSEIVSYIGFASALVSIVLALVAIFYSIVQNVNSQQNIGEMRTLVSEASRIMTEKAGTLTEHAVSIQKIIEQLFEKRATASSTTTTPSRDDLFRFDASGATLVFLLTFYYLVKCHQLRKPMQLNYIGTLIFDISPENEEKKKFNEGLGLMYGIGVLQSLDCFLQLRSYDIKGRGNRVEIKEIPSVIEQNILTVVNRQIEDEKCKSSGRSWLEDSVKEIDAHVEAA